MGRRTFVGLRGDLFNGLESLILPIAVRNIQVKVRCRVQPGVRASQPVGLLLLLDIYIDGLYRPGSWLRARRMARSVLRIAWNVFINSTTRPMPHLSEERKQQGV